MHDKEADEKATAVYFRKNVRDQADSVDLVAVVEPDPHGNADLYEPKILIQAKSPVAELVDLAAEKQKRLDAAKQVKYDGILGPLSGPFTTQGFLDSLGVGHVYETKDSGAREELTRDKFGDDLYEVYRSARYLCLQKHQDYGPKNIALSPGGPLNGLRVRLWDKTARINHLIDNGAEPSNESLRDSFVDMLNYCAIALMVLDGNWPSE